MSNNTPKEKCNCEEMTCKEGCNENHTHKTFWCEKCHPERFDTPKEKKCSRGGGFGCACPKCYKAVMEKIDEVFPRQPDSLNLCSKCNTMKHIEKGGICSRCQPDSMEWEKEFNLNWAKDDEPRLRNYALEFIRKWVALSRAEEHQFFLNILDGIDQADKEMGNSGGGTEAIRHALQSRIINL